MSEELETYLESNDISLEELRKMVFQKFTQLNNEGDKSVITPAFNAIDAAVEIISILPSKCGQTIRAQISEEIADDLLANLDTTTLTIK